MKNLPESELDRVDPRPVCRKKVWMHNVSLRSCPYCLGARFKFSQRSHDPKKGVGTRRLFSFLFLAAYAARDCFAAKSHSTTIQYHQLRRLAQCRKEKNGVQRSSLKSTASWAFTLEALGS